MGHRFTIAAALTLLIMGSGRIKAADEIPVLSFADVQNEGHGFLVAVDGEIAFRKGMRGKRTKWNVEFRKDGHRIVTAYRGKLLGIDAKTKQLALFDKAGPHTNWQFKSTGGEPDPDDNDFSVIIYMKLGEEELRLSSDQEGTPVLGGKADILHFYIDGP